jgi:hypothetical protein
METLQKKITDKSSSINHIPIEDVVVYFSSFFKENMQELLRLKNPWYRDTYNIAMILIEIFCTCWIVTSKNKMRTQGKKHVMTVLWLQHKLKNIIPFSHHLPRIITPKIMDTHNNLENLIAYYPKGSKLYISLK